MIDGLSDGIWAARRITDPHSTMVLQTIVKGPFTLNDRGFSVGGQASCRSERLRERRGGLERQPRIRLVDRDLRLTGRQWNDELRDHQIEEERGS
jgi:hypothetical protein